MRGKDAFAAAAQGMAGKVRIEGRSDIQEVRVFGDWAYVWTELTITMHPASGGAPVHRRGPGLSVWRKNPDGRWVIVRDANMVTTQEKTGERAGFLSRPAARQSDRFSTRAATAAGRRASRPARR